MDEMQEMLEHYRITKLVNEYCHGCDRGDAIRMGSVYSNDSWDDHGVFRMQGKPFAEQVIQHRLDRGDVMSHQLGQTLVTVEGDEAGAETYFVASVRWADDAGLETLHQLGGRYVDALVREDGKWKIRERLTVRDWSISHPVKTDWMGTLDFIPGMTSNTDPSFAVLRVRHSGGGAPFDSSVRRKQREEASA